MNTQKKSFFSGVRKRQCDGGSDLRTLVTGAGVCVGARSMVRRQRELNLDRHRLLIEIQLAFRSTLPG